MSHRSQGYDRADERNRMVRDQLHGRDIFNERVLAAMRYVPRHLFVPKALRRKAYADRPLSIGRGQTISQPYMVAAMTQLLGFQTGEERVLEIGTGCGYQTAVLAEVSTEVYTVEIDELLGERAARLLAELGYTSIRNRVGDGYDGWVQYAPFDRILLTAAPPEIPVPLLDQLADGGVLVAPVGPVDRPQELVRVRRVGDALEREVIGLVRFVPMTGKAQAPMDDD